ncbi:MAG: thermonuclease family protein [Treponema sp.]|jgi:micrococcal nuclease|nr:thermonuclease family protein [Treponema sp.]
MKKLLIVITSLFFLFACNKDENPTRRAERYRVDTHTIAASGEVHISALTKAYVTRVIDGDTIDVAIEDPPEELETSERIRFLGVDTPETVHPNKEVEQFGKEASGYTKTALTRKTVYLAFDRDLRDQYGRVLAYVYTEDNVCFNAELIKQGYARAYTSFPFQFKDEFVKLEETAQATNTGLWELE